MFLEQYATDWNGKTANSKRCAVTPYEKPLTESGRILELIASRAVVAELVVSGESPAQSFEFLSIEYVEAELVNGYEITRAQVTHAVDEGLSAIAQLELGSEAEIRISYECDSDDLSMKFRPYCGMLRKLRVEPNTGKVLVELAKQVD